MDQGTVDEIERRFGVIAESLRDEIRAVAERCLGLGDLELPDLIRRPG